MLFLANYFFIGIGSLAKTFSGPIIMSLSIACGGFAATSYWRGLVIASKNQKIIDCGERLASNQLLIENLEAITEARQLQIDQGALAAKNIKNESLKKVKAIKSLQITGDCVADMQKLALEAQK